VSKNTVATLMAQQQLVARRKRRRRAGHGDGDGPSTTDAPIVPGPSTAEVRAWARAHSINVPDRGRLRPEIWQAWHQAHPPHP